MTPCKITHWAVFPKELVGKDGMLCTAAWILPVGKYISKPITKYMNTEEFNFERTYELADRNAREAIFSTVIFN